MAAAELTAHALIAQHRPTLDQALEAIRTRAYWSPHPEHPKAYGENGSLGMAEGKAAFDALLGTRIDLGQPWRSGQPGPAGPPPGERPAERGRPGHLLRRRPHRIHRLPHPRRGTEVTWHRRATRRAPVEAPPEGEGTG